MITPCGSCAYKLWSVEREVKGWPVRVYFDGEQTSETYADQVTRCPGCGKWLVELAFKEAWPSRDDANRRVGGGSYGSFL